MKPVKTVRPLSFCAQACSVSLLFCFLPCHATCTIANPAIVSLGDASLSSNTIRATSGPSKFQYSFFIKCSAAASYKLAVASLDASQTSGLLTLSNERGDQITVTARLKSVGGSPVNAEFSNLPGGYYTGAISADQSQEVIVELIPVNSIKPKSARASGGSYKGNAVVNLIY